MGRKGPGENLGAGSIKDRHLIKDNIEMKPLRAKQNPGASGFSAPLAMSRTPAQRELPARDRLIWDWRTAQRLRMLQESKARTEKGLQPRAKGRTARFEVRNTAAAVEQLGEAGAGEGNNSRLPGDCRPPEGSPTPRNQDFLILS